MVNQIELIISLTALVDVRIEHINLPGFLLQLKAPHYRLLLRLLLNFFVLRFIELYELVC